MVRAQLRSARNARLPGGKPRWMCAEPGCHEPGSPCVYPDWDRDETPGRRRHPDACSCDRHIRHTGFCRGCGRFSGGVESFAFGRFAGWCDNGAAELERAADEERAWDAGDVDWDDDPYDREWD